MGEEINERVQNRTSSGRAAPGKTTDKKAASKKSDSKVWVILKAVWKYVWMFRGFLISIPVLVIAIKEAFRNAATLPEKVGLNIQATGEFGMTVTRSAAVMTPLLLTIACILMATFTKRPLFPWLVSIFSLLLPWVIWIINNYPV